MGTGRFFRHYRAVKRLAGIDISVEMLREAAQRTCDLSGETSVTLERGDVFGLRFADGEFEATIVWRLLHLLPVELLPKAIRELCRVTRDQVIAQTYAAVPPPADLPRGAYDTAVGHLRRVASRIAGPRLRSVLRGAWSSPTTETTKPWDHIEAFWHSQTDIDEMFKSQGFDRSLSVVLDTYDNSEVRATVYQRSE